jgi:hypothetical protein
VKQPQSLFVAALICGAWVCISLFTGKTLNLWRGSGPSIADREADTSYFWASVWSVGTVGALFATVFVLFDLGAF